MFLTKLKKHPFLFSLTIVAAINILSFSFFAFSGIIGQVQLSKAEAARDADPIVSTYYSLEATPMMSGFFTEVKGLGSENVIVEHTVVDRTGQQVVQKLPGTLKYFNVVLQRGLTADLTASDWRKLVEDGRITEARVNGSITMFNQEGRPVAVWEIQNAWPSSLSAPGENGQETLTLVCDSIERVQ